MFIKRLSTLLLVGLISLALVVSALAAAGSASHALNAQTSASRVEEQRVLPDFPSFSSAEPFPGGGYRGGEAVQRAITQPVALPENPVFSLRDGNGIAGGDIFGLSANPGDPPVVIIPAANLGLVPGDDIDALSLGGVITTSNGGPLPPCSGFEALSLTSSYVVGNVFIDSGEVFTATDFIWSNSTVYTSGWATVENGGNAGGVGQEMHLNNISLAMNFNPSTPGLSFLFGEYGGNLNLAVNGDFRNFANFVDIDGLTIGGVSVSVVNGFGNDQGSVTLTGPINSLVLGGQELYLDEICSGGPVPPPPETKEVVNFSVRASALGISGTAVWVEAACLPVEAAGDEFTVMTPGQNGQVFDEDGAPCGSNAGFPLGLSLADDLDGLDETPPEIVDKEKDGFPDLPVFFSLRQGSPSVAALSTTPADVLSTSHGITPAIFASYISLGLVPGDDIDALALIENHNGVFDPATFSYPEGDLLVFSLAAGSPTLSALGANPGDLLVPAKDGGASPVVAFPASLSGLLAADDLNALKADVAFLWELAPFPAAFDPVPPSGCVLYSPGGPEGWTPKAPLPLKREGGFATIIGNSIIMGQGASNFGDDTFNFVYDIPSDTWFAAAPALIGRAEMTSVCAEESGQGKVFVIGGRGGVSNTVLSDVHVFDPATNSWAIRSPMPTPRAGLGAAYVPISDTIFVIGGRTGLIPHDGAPLDVVEAYRVSSGTWTTRAPLPIPMMDIYSTVYFSPTHEIYVFGGYDGSNVTDLVQVYDVANDTWYVASAPMPTPRSNALAGVCEGEIHVIGGFDGFNEFAVNEAFNPLTGLWTVGYSPLPNPRSEFMTQGIFTGKEIYALGDGIHGNPDPPHDMYTCGPLGSGPAVLGDFAWDDQNGNGVQEAGEPGLPGVDVSLYNITGTLLMTYTTNAGGYYTFTGVLPDRYFLKFTAPLGWEFTRKNAGYDDMLDSDVDPFSGETDNFVVFSGTVALGWDAGLFQPGEIHGYKWEDANANGSWDTLELPVNGWEMWLFSQDGWGVTTTTNISGEYAFVGLPAGLYTVTEVITPAWWQTWPAWPDFEYTVTLHSGENVTGLDFGNLHQPGEILGEKFEDFNGDGSWDRSFEPSLYGWEISLESPFGWAISTTTDAFGKFWFPGLPAGVYTITEAIPQGWGQSQPGSPGLDYLVSLQASEVITGLVFGNYQTAEIQGGKFEDLNGNGDWEPGEPGIPGWTVFLEDALGQVVSTTTSAGGQYWFTDLPPGMYTVTEELRSGWLPSFPSQGGYVIMLGSGMVVNDLVFGNYHTGAIHGRKFEDSNGDGKWNVGESFLQGWPIYLDLNMNGQWDAGEPVTLTNALGGYSFTNLEPGFYVVAEVFQDNWQQTLPGAPYFVYFVLLHSSEVIQGINFGNFQPQVAGAIEVFSIAPDNGKNIGATPVVIDGANFQAGAVPDLEGTPLLSVTVVSPNRIEALVPAGMSPGTYDLTVTNPDSTNDTLLGAFTAWEPTITLTNMLPSQGPNNLPMEVMILGDNLAGVVTATLSSATRNTSTGIELEGLILVDNTLLLGTVPISSTPGTYDLVVVSRSGLTTTLPQAYTVLDASLNDDLFATADDLRLQPQAVHAGDADPTLLLTVRRQGGSGVLTNVPVTVFQTGSVVSGRAAFSRTVLMSFAPDEVVTKTVTWPLPGAGRYTLHMVIDPGNQVPEDSEMNNITSLDVTVHPAAPDLTPPEVISFTINGGNQVAGSRQVRLDTTAVDTLVSNRATPSGVSHLLYVEYVYNQVKADWEVAQISGWLKYDQAATDYPWLLFPVGGVHYMEVYAADNAGNISPTPGRQLVTFIPPLSHVSAGGVDVFRLALSAGQSYTVTLTAFSGVADLYIWSPDGSLLALDETNTSVKELAFTAVVNGVYQIEVEGFTSALYHLELEENTSVRASNLRGILAVMRGRDRPLVGPGEEPDEDVSVPSAPSSSSQLFLPLIVR